MYVNMAEETKLVRLPVGLFDEAGRLADALTEQRGIKNTRSAILRYCLKEGLSKLERELSETSERQ